MHAYSINCMKDSIHIPSLGHGIDQRLFIKFLQSGCGKSLLAPEIATAYGRAQEQHTRSLALRTSQ